VLATSSRSCNAVLVEGRSVKEVCEAHDRSRSWLYELIARYRELDDGLKPQCKRPRSSPTRVAPAIKDDIVPLRKELTDLGVAAGAHTIQYTTSNAVTVAAGRPCLRWPPSGGS
jgi:transposase